MKRLFIIFTLFAAWLCPPQWTPQFIDTGNSAITLQAKGKKATKKNKQQKRANKKNNKKSYSYTKKERTSSRQNLSVVPTISSLVSSSNAQASNSLMRAKMPTSRVTQTVNYKALTVYFCPKLRIPLCVGYELTSTRVAMSDAPDAEKRRNYQFNADGRVPGCPNWNEYKSSGYTRGHMAPAMDMRWDKQAMTDCFYMTNICPQEEKLNNAHWRTLEEKVHAWAKRDGRLIVLTGPIVSAQPTCVGPKHDIAVPDAFYKVVYAPQQNRAIAFIYANRPCPGGIERYAVSIDEVERRTGIDFFTALSDNVERTIEAQCNINAWK